jgi:UDP-N-acetylmuramoylalanine--D-glutamate ligase
MVDAWGDDVVCLPCDTLKKAVFSAFENAVPGETVLLSPACASFDQFSSFNERGEVFVNEVKQLQSRCRM